jgi:glucose-6-phosphate 1-epimerase
MNIWPTRVSRLTLEGNMSESISIQSLDQRFGLAGIAQVVSGNGGLPKIEINSPDASAEIYLHGAQVTSWQPAGADEVLFVSEQSHWEDGKAIRGGVPICFPWFRAKADSLEAPAHGFVRTKSWRLESITNIQDAVVVSLQTESDETTRKWWPFEFSLIQRITVGASLKLELTVTNTGQTPFQFEEALHTYNRIGSIATAHVSGLAGVAFLDNQDGNQVKLQTGDLQLTGPTDNAYINTLGAAEVLDPILRRTIQLKKQGSHTTVVWNPWQQGASSLADLRDDEWQQFVCVEASNILSSIVHLAAGEQHTLVANIHVSGTSE